MSADKPRIGFVGLGLMGHGIARNLKEVVRFYDDRFGIGFTDQERDDLVAFLKAL